MKLDTLTTLAAETAKSTVEQYWNANLAQELQANCNKILYLTGSAAGYGVARTAACLEADADLVILNQVDFNYGTLNIDNGCLMIADFDGSDPDTAVSLDVAKSKNMHTILLTVDTNDTNAEKSDICININANAGCYGWTAYLAAQIIVLATTGSRAVSNGKMSKERFEAIGNNIVDYAACVAKHTEAITDGARAFAEISASKNQLDLIADSCLESISEYLRSLYCQEAGYLCSVNDCEEWCHVDFWCLNRHDIAAICACPEGAPSFSRFAESMMTVHRLERPYLIITDAAVDNFYGGTTICRMPALKKENWFLASLFFPIPALIALNLIKEFTK